MVVRRVVEGSLPVVVLVIDDDHLRSRAVRPLVAEVLRMRGVELRVASVLLFVEGDLDGLAVGGHSGLVLFLVLLVVLISLVLALAVPHAVLVLKQSRRANAL